jgi:hypothetical protein
MHSSSAVDGVPSTVLLLCNGVHPPVCCCDLCRLSCVRVLLLCTRVTSVHTCVLDVHYRTKFKFSTKFSTAVCLVYCVLEK